MTQQLSLSLPDRRAGRSRRNDPATSKAAAASVDVSRQRDVLLRELRSTSVGRTPDELEDVTGIPRYIVASRLAQMKRDRLCEPFGTRVNRAGRKVQIWFALAPQPVQDVQVKEGRL